MSVKERLPLAHAEVLANDLLTLLMPGCERVAIAGSIRRRKADVGDIEIVCAPVLEEARDLFGNVIGQTSQLENVIARLEADGYLTRRVSDKGASAWGPRLKRATFRGFAADIFAVLEPAAWGVIYLIRTGSAEFSHRLVTPKRHGGMMPEWAQVRDGAIWHRDGTKMPTPEEQDVFDLIDSPFIPPEARAS